MSLPFHGETVTAITWHPISRGFIKEFKCYFQVEVPDAKPVTNSCMFDQRVADTFVAAGYDVAWSFTYASHAINADIVIEDIDNRYRIVGIYAQDGTLHTVPEKPKGTTSSRNPNPNELKRLYTDPSTLARIERKKQASEETKVIDHRIFAHGEQMIRDELARIRAQRKEQTSIFRLHNAAWHWRMIA